ncbi:MAG: hypothetical protein A2Y30_10825 [Spirochaetes bacterium GWE1_32_154]|nr:MAG: hypothetical protein A2Y30_10825 [Spirochaetes bacterium GWE1_32_154]
MKCYKCLFSQTNCFCNDIIPIDTNVKIVILIHPMEAKNQRTGTGRLTHLSINDSELIIGIDFTNNKRVNELINDKTFYPVLLYPSDKALNIEDKTFYNSLENKKLLIFILDGTWWHARVMLRESSNLMQIPHISFEQKYTSKYFFKKQPKENYLSTIECVYYLLSSLKENNLANKSANYQNLMSIFDRLISQQRQFWGGNDKNSLL